MYAQVLAEEGQLLTSAALSFTVWFGTPPFYILAVKCKCIELRSRYSSPLPIIVNSKVAVLLVFNRLFISCRSSSTKRRLIDF